MGFFRRNRDRKALDENQRQYREKFGIVDRYLLQYSIDDENGRNNSYIIFIDYEYAIDWVDNRDKSTWSEADRNRFNAYTARLELIQSRPIFNLTNYEKLAYKVMLGAAYIQVFQCQFDEVDNTIAAAEFFSTSGILKTHASFVSIIPAWSLLWVFSSCCVSIHWTYLTTLVLSERSPFSWECSVPMSPFGEGTLVTHWRGCPPNGFM